MTNSHLSSYISTAKSLNPHTKEAFRLIESAERLTKLRGLVMPSEDPEQRINWNNVKKIVKEILIDIEKNNALHKIILHEIKLVLDVADDRIMRDCMEIALSTGCPAGEPGRINVSTMSSSQLEKAYQQGVRSSLKTENSKLLLIICRHA